MKNYKNYLHLLVVIFVYAFYFYFPAYGQPWYANIFVVILSMVYALMASYFISGAREHKAGKVSFLFIIAALIFLAEPFRNAFE